MQRVQTDLTCGKFCIYIAVIGIFILLGGNFECTCKPQALDCSVYLLLPVFIVFLFILWTDKSFQRVCRCMFGGRGWSYSCNFLGSFIHHIIRAAFIGLLWVVAVLVNGNWFVCCLNDHSEQQAQLACRSTGSITEEERVVIAELKNESRVIGSFLLFGIICVPAFMSSFGWRKSSRKKLYDKLILAEEDKVLKEIFRKSAKERLTEGVKAKIREGRWEECFDVAEELITASTGPITCEQEDDQ